MVSTSEELRVGACPGGVAGVVLPVGSGGAGRGEEDPSGVSPDSGVCGGLAMMAVDVNSDQRIQGDVRGYLGIRTDKIGEVICQFRCQGVPKPRYLFHM